MRFNQDDHDIKKDLIHYSLIRQIFRRSRRKEDVMVLYYALCYDIMYYATLLYITYIIHNMTYKIYLITLGHQYRRNKNIDDALEKY